MKPTRVIKCLSLVSSLVGMNLPTHFLIIPQTADTCRTSLLAGSEPKTSGSLSTLIRVDSSDLRQSQSHRQLVNFNLQTNAPHAPLPGQAQGLGQLLAPNVPGLPAAGGLLGLDLSVDNRFPNAAMILQQHQQAQYPLSHKSATHLAWQKNQIPQGLEQRNVIKESIPHMDSLLTSKSQSRGSEGHYDEKERLKRLRTSGVSGAGLASQPVIMVRIFIQCGSHISCHTFIMPLLIPTCTGEKLHRIRRSDYKPVPAVSSRTHSV